MEVFNQDKQNVKHSVDLGFFEYEILQSVVNGELDGIIRHVRPSLILLPYYVSYLFPFFKKRYHEINFCCINILLRGELFTPEYLYNFHYNFQDEASKGKIKSLLKTTAISADRIVQDYYSDFKELILFPGEMDLSDKYSGQNVEYSEAIIDQTEKFDDTLDERNIILFSMGSNSNLFPCILCKNGPGIFFSVFPNF